MKFFKKKTLNKIIYSSGLIFLFSLLTTLDTTAQVHLHYLDSLKTNDFDEIVKLTEEYYSNRDKGKGTGYKQFKRWELKNSTRLGKNRKLINYTKINYDERLKALNRSQPNESDWQPVGANKFDPLEPTSTQARNAYTGGLGRLNCIAIDPNNSQVIYVGTPSSGLWKTTTGGSDWNDPNATPSWTPLLQDRCTGVSGIVVDPFDSQTIYVLTGDGDGADTNTIGVLKSEDGGLSWTSILEWRTNQVVRGYKLALLRNNTNSPGSIFVATSVGLFISDDNGDWSIAPLNLCRVLPIDEICRSLPIDPTISITNPMIENRVVPVIEGAFFDIEFHPTNSDIVYVSTDKKIYKSDDSGVSWTLSTGYSGHLGQRIELAVTPANSNYVYAVVGNGDGAPALNPDGSINTEAGITGAFGGLYRSTDVGSTFFQQSRTPNILGLERQSTTSQATYDLAIAVNPNNVHQVHVGGINCWRSPNGGIDWDMTAHWRYDGNDEIFTHGDIHDLVFDDNNNTLYCVSDGGIFKTINYSSNSDVNTTSENLKNLQWKNISYGLQISQIYNIGVNKNPAIESSMSFGAQDIGLNLRINDGDENNPEFNWIHWLGADGAETIFDPFNDYILYGAIQNNQLRRFNVLNGDITSLFPTKKGTDPLLYIYEFGGGAFIAPFDLNQIDGSLTLPVKGAIVRYENPSTDTSEDWINLSNGQINSLAQFTSLVVAPSNSDVIFAGTKIGSNSILYMTYDSGTNWRQYDFTTNFTSFYPASHIVFHPTDPKIVWVTFPSRSDNNFGRVFKTIDGGQNWQDISIDNGLPLVNVNSIVYQNGGYDNGSSLNRLYVGTDCGVYYIEDGLDDWVSFNDNLPAVIVSDLEINYCSDMIYAGTHGRGVWQSQLQTSSFSPSLDFTDNHTDSNIFISNSFVESEIGVDSDVNVVYQGSSYVCLQPGFIAMPNNGSYFCGQIIDRCNATVPFTANRVFEEIVENMDGVQLGNIGGSRIFEEVISDNNLKILGNPSSGKASVSFDLDSQSPVSLHIYDQQGKFIKQILDNVNLDVGNHQYNLQMSDHQKGVYFIALCYGDKKSIRKLVKL